MFKIVLLSKSDYKTGIFLCICGCVCSGAGCLGGGGGMQDDVCVDWTLCVECDVCIWGWVCGGAVWCVH